MTKIIGFAGTFFTLWSYEEVTSIQGDFRIFETKYYYQKNISSDIEKVKSLFPNVEINMTLKGKSDFVSCTNKEFVNPFKSAEDLIPFGKYVGKSIQYVFENDIDYLVWISENSYNRGLKEFAYEITTDFRSKKAAAQQAKFDNISTFKSGEIVEFEITFNKNLTIYEMQSSDDAEMEELNSELFAYANENEVKENGLRIDGGLWAADVKYSKEIENKNNRLNWLMRNGNFKKESFAVYTHDFENGLFADFHFAKFKEMQYNGFFYGLLINEKTGKGMKIKGKSFKVTAKAGEVELKSEEKVQVFEVIKIS